MSGRSLADVRAAARRIAGTAVRTPLVRLPVDRDDTEFWLKLETLQPIRSFKIRGAANKILGLDAAELAAGVWTASAGNMAQGVAWCARALDIPCTVVVPEGAPHAKCDAVAALGARLVAVPFDDWYAIYETRQHPGMSGAFVHAFSDPAVMAGNGTIALEILDELADIDAVVIPYGGGGLAAGIAGVVRELSPRSRIYAAEVASAAPLTAAFSAGHPVPIEHERTFVDGIGGPRLFPEMWNLASKLLDGTVVASVEEVRAAVRTLATTSAVVAEGAGAASVAAAVAGRAGSGRIVCIVSGGNIDAGVLSAILAGATP